MKRKIFICQLFLLALFPTELTYATHLQPSGEPNYYRAEFRFFKRGLYVNSLENVTIIRICNSQKDTFKLGKYSWLPMRYPEENIENPKCWCHFKHKDYLLFDKQGNSDSSLVQFRPGTDNFVEIVGIHKDSLKTEANRIRFVRKIQNKQNLFGPKLTQIAQEYVKTGTAYSTPDDFNDAVRKLQISIKPGSIVKGLREGGRVELVRQICNSPENPMSQEEIDNLIVGVNAGSWAQWDNAIQSLGSSISTYPESFAKLLVRERKASNSKGASRQEKNLWATLGENLKIPEESDASEKAIPITLSGYSILGSSLNQDMNFLWGFGIRTHLSGTKLSASTEFFRQASPLGTPFPANINYMQIFFDYSFFRRQKKDFRTDLFVSAAPVVASMRGFFPGYGFAVQAGGRLNYKQGFAGISFQGRWVFQNQFSNAEEWPSYQVVLARLGIYIIKSP